VTLHILPLNDLKEHTESDDCGCKPRVEYVGEGEKLVIHNSYDGREFWEEWEAEKGKHEL
jgi:hypothetical protein